MEISATDVKNLRTRTGAGIMNCKHALESCGGDLEKAFEFLRKKGLADAERKIQREAKDGLVGSYIHAGGKLGVLIEINCETDFVAKTIEFQQLLKELSMQIAAANPLYISRDDVPGEIIEKEKEIYRAQLEGTKKPPHVIEKIIEGKIEKYYSEICLMEQLYIRDTSITVKDLIMQKIALLGEKVAVRRFTRFQVGGA